MALSRETLISMVKNEYPSSYSSDVEKMSHEDLMGLLDYLDSIKGKADGGRVGMLSGGLLKVGIMKALEQIKDMDEGNLFSTLDPLGKARTIRDALLDRIDGFKEMIKDLKTQAMDHPEIEDIKFEMDEAKDGLKKINEYIENQPTNRTLQADGGAIGIEVLFRDKKANGGRVNFQNGGSGNWWDGLTGEAKGIYDSMTAYGASDAEIQAKLQAQNLWSPDGTTDTEQVTGIINQDIGGDGGGIGGLDLTYTKERMPPPIDPTGMLPQVSTQRTGLLGIKDKAVDFLSNLGTPKVQGTLGTRLSNQPRLPLPAAMASWSMSPFNTESRNYNPNFVDQLNFLETQDGMIGRDQGSGLLRYGPESVLAGKNVISMFGTNDYEEMLRDYLTKMEANEKISAAGKAAKIAQVNAELAALAANKNKGGDGSSGDGGSGGIGPQFGDKDYADPGVDAEENQPGSGWSPGSGNQGTTPGAGLHADYRRGGLATMFTRRR